MSLKNKINKALTKFGVELHGISYLQSLAKGDFKNDEIEFLTKLYGNKEILIYDVGANKGIMIEKFNNHFPKSHIHAFEPYEEYADMIKTKFGDNKKIVINQLGISNQTGTLSFNVNKSIDTSSFLDSKKTGLNSDASVETIKQVTVPITKIDTYAANNSHEKIHLLKLDIQGSELNTLKGAEKLLKEGKIDCIFSETYFIQQYIDQPTFFDIANYLLTLGYVVQDIYHPIYGNGKLAWCDTLFVRQNVKYE